MKSDFEKNAAQEAVEAVERRWERNQKLAQRVRGRRWFLRGAACLAVAVVGILLWRYFAKGRIPFLPTASSLPPAIGFWLRADDAADEARFHYGKTLEFLLTGKVHPSSELPDELRIANAQPDVRYSILSTPSAGWFGVYELARNAKGEIAVSELSPVSPARQVSTADLRAACGGRPHLVAVCGKVYLFASKDRADAAHLRSQVRAIIGK